MLLVQRWILARLRNRRFFNLAELNAAIRLLLIDLNQRPEIRKLIIGEQTKVVALGVI